MDFEAIKAAAAAYRSDMSRFLRDMIAIPSESCEEEGVVRRIARERGYSFLQVKTVQMGRYPEYDATNRFYLSLGFKEFEVFPTLWDEWNPCQIYVMSVDDSE